MDLLCAHLCSSNHLLRVPACLIVRLDADIDDRNDRKGKEGRVDSAEDLDERGCKDIRSSWPR